MMALSISLVDMNAIIARQLGVDWIKVNNDRWIRGVPDLVTEDSEKRKESFWCPEVRWAVAGKEYAAAIPVKTRVRNWKSYHGFDIFNARHHYVHEMDEAAMLNELAIIVQSMLIRLTPTKTKS